MTYGEIISLIGVCIAFFGLLVVGVKAHTNIQVRLSLIEQENLKFKKDLEDHKTINDHEFNDMNREMATSRQESREDHFKIMEAFEKMTEAIKHIEINCALRSGQYNETNKHV